MEEREKERESSQTCMFHGGAREFSAFEIAMKGTYFGPPLFLPLLPPHLMRRLCLLGSCSPEAAVSLGAVLEVLHRRRQDLFKGHHDRAAATCHLLQHHYVNQPPETSTTSALYSRQIKSLQPLTMSVKKSSFLYTTSIGRSDIQVIQH